jgi:hypothetical protein
VSGGRATQETGDSFGRGRHRGEARQVRGTGRESLREEETQECQGSRGQRRNPAAAPPTARGMNPLERSRAVLTGAACRRPREAIFGWTHERYRVEPIAGGESRVERQGRSLASQALKGQTP